MPPRNPPSGRLGFLEGSGEGAVADDVAEVEAAVESPTLTVDSKRRAIRTALERTNTVLIRDSIFQGFLEIKKKRIPLLQKKTFLFFFFLS